MRHEHFFRIGKSLRGAWGLLAAACLLLQAACAVSSCTSIDCPVQNLVYTNYVLTKGDGSQDTLKTDTLWIWSHRQDGSDTLLINALCGASALGFSLPISYSSPEDVFYTLLADTAGHYFIDTIRIKKDNIPHFESVDCQAAYFHNITQVGTTRHAFDSIAVHHSHVDYDVSQQHLYLYPKAER